MPYDAYAHAIPYSLLAGINMNPWCTHSLPVVAVLFGMGMTADAGMIDQAHDPFPTGAVSDVYNLVDWSQTFTVGLSGTLSSVDLRVWRSFDFVAAPLLIDIRTIGGATPTEPDAGGNILASLSIAAASVPTTEGLINVDLSGFGLAVNPGNKLAIALRSNDSVVGAYQWRGSTTNGYAGGSAFFRTSGNWTGTGISQVQDLNFKTYVQGEASTVPEPASISLFGMGGLALCVARRRRRSEALP